MRHVGDRKDAMYRYIIKRVLSVIPTLVGAAALVFVVMRLIPGDICAIRLGSGGTMADPRAIARCHAELGLDRSMAAQFIDFAWGFFRLDFGISMWSGKPVPSEIAARFPISLEICILAVIVANLIAIPLGTISALKQNSPIDLVIRTISIAGLATRIAIAWIAARARWRALARSSTPPGRASRSITPKLTLSRTDMVSKRARF